MTFSVYDSLKVIIRPHPHSPSSNTSRYALWQPWMFLFIFFFVLAFFFRVLVSQKPSIMVNPTDFREFVLLARSEAAVGEFQGFALPFTL